MNEINIHRGRSKTIRVPVIYKDGTACTLTGYDYIFFAVKADKDGVEGAAFTVMTLAGSAPFELIKLKYDFTLDRPFVFVIENGGTPLFVGCVNDVG